MTERDELSAALHRLSRLIGSRTVYTRHAHAAGIDLPQQAIQVLRTLDGHDSQPVSEVARAAHMDMGAVSRQLRVLEDRGLVSRCPSATNGSVVLVEATTDGQATVERFMAVGTGHIHAAIATWSPDDRDHLAALLSRFVADLQATPLEG